MLFLFRCGAVRWLSRIENGTLPDLETFSKICLFLKLDPAKILQVLLDRGRAGRRG
jgi:hypothetical protein